MSDGRRSPGRALRAWARLLVALYPPGFRASVGGDLAQLLVDGARARFRRGRRPGVGFVVANTARGLRDAAVEWGSTAIHGWTTMRGEIMGPSWLYSLRLAVKALVRRPGYTVPVVLTLALGIGANTATFTLLDSVVLAPLPYPAADRIVRVFPARVDEGTNLAAFSLPDLRDWEEQSATLSGLGAYSTLNSNLVYTGGDDALEAETAYVTAGFYRALGREPILGRLPTAEEEQGDNRVVTVSHGFWQQSLGGDPDVVGATIQLSGEPFTVAGVMPRTFAYPSERTEVWAFLSIIPPASTPYHVRGVRLLGALGRIAEGYSAEQVRSELTTIATGLAEAYPESNEGLRGAVVQPLHDDVVGNASNALFLLMAAAGLILLVTWANLANLALARELRRAPELAIRAALGAGRLRRAGLVLTECLLLSAVAGSLGWALAVVGTDALVTLGDSVLPRAHEIAPDWRVALFTLGASLLTGVSVAALASMRAGREVAGAARRAGREKAAGLAQDLLVVSQVAVSVILLVGTALLGRSLDAMGRVDIGFDPEDLVVAEITFGSNRFPERADYLPRFEATLDALRSVPGVRSASSIRRFPFRGEGEGVRWRLPEWSADDEGVPANLVQVSPSVFETMGIHLVEGPGFDAADVASGRSVVVVGQAVADAAYPGSSPVGRTLVVGGVSREVVGVVGDIRQSDLRSDPRGVLYVPNALDPRRAAAFVVRAEPGADGVLAGVRAAVRRIDGEQPITELALASIVVRGELDQQRFLTLLLSLFAIVALTLCAMGVYGVVAFGISRRRREVGIRLALGADPRNVRSRVVRDGMRPVVVGAVIGALLTVVVSGGVERLLFSVGRYEPLAYGGTLAVLALVGLAACWIPARRAVGESTLVAMRDD